MSDPVRERLDSLRARFILSSAVVSFHYHQEETVGDIGYFRVRCTLIDGSELQLIERFRDVANALAVEKYSFHWQRNDGTPICRWDSVFYRRGLIETWGRGTLKIAGLMREAGLQAPALNDDSGFVTLTFVLPASVAPRVQGSGSDETLGKTPDLILSWLAEAPGASIPELAQHLGKSESAIERAIRKLRADWQADPHWRRQRRPLAGNCMMGRVQSLV